MEKNGANFRHPTVKAAVQLSFLLSPQAHHAALFTPSLLDTNEMFPTSSPAFHFNFHFICISFPPGFLIMSPQSYTPFLIAAAALSLSTPLSLHLLLPKRRRDFSSIVEKVIFSLLQISRSVLSFVFARFRSIDLFISRFLFSFRSLVFGMEIGRSVVDRF